jgi:hypothetical protein
MSETQNIIEKILFRRALEHKLEGYTLETAVEISEALKPEYCCPECAAPLELAKQRVTIVERLMKLSYIKATRNASMGQEIFVCRDDDYDDS